MRQRVDGIVLMRFVPGLLLACVMTAPATGAAADAPYLRGITTLEALAPTPAATLPGTRRVRERSAPPDVRQRVGPVNVPSQCDNGSCTDGLADGKRVLLPARPDADERAVLAGGGSLQRVVRIAHVDARWISAYLGLSEFSGGANAGNELECATFDRRSGRRAVLSQAVGADRARRLVSAARTLLKDESADISDGSWSFQPRSFVLGPRGRVVLCGLAATHREGEVLEVGFDAPGADGVEAGR